jgi:hypothetical protein
MSNYNTITSLSESPIKEGLLYAGTDDGFIQVTENGGNSWRKIPVRSLGIPERSFVNDIKADLFDSNTVYVALDNHKEGDYQPYLYKSSDKGLTWKSISSNMPDRTLVWRIVQDPIKENLLFAATEYGVYTSLNGGVSWQKLPGTPTISFRDLTIQKRENDLVAASFGRGFYVLDDYSALREFTKDNLSKKGKLFSPRPAKWFVQRSNVGNTGADYYFSKNPEFGAVFTYHLSNDYKTKKELRQEKERKLNKNKIDIPFPGWNSLDAEKQEAPAQVILTIQDKEGNIINKIKQNASKGSHRIVWNLEHFNPFAISMSGGVGYGGGVLVTPGTYKASLHLEEDGKIFKLDGPLSFQVKPIRKGVLKGASFEDYNEFRVELTELINKISKVEDQFTQSKKMYNALEKALQRSRIAPGKIEPQLLDLKVAIASTDKLMNGSSSRSEIGERNPSGIQNYLYGAFSGMDSSYGPTGLHKKSLSTAKKILDKVQKMVNKISYSMIPEIEKKLKDAGAPYISN